MAPDGAQRFDFRNCMQSGRKLGPHREELGPAALCISYAKDTGVGSADEGGTGGDVREDRAQALGTAEYQTDFWPDKASTNRP